ncbi:hypothetical protein [Streptomyces canus]|uniref:hypothetical protein n=1 Tax=Streptomyces canus TaxID=58343 RepID=UPI00037B1254|nr:hypothetical protein [Streptomyces canus]
MARSCARAEHRGSRPLRPAALCALLARPHTSERRFPEFAIRIDPSTGERVTSTCDPAKLSNYVTDRGTPQYLTRVLFRREVLGLYTSQPSRYRIEDGRLSPLG